MPCYEYECPKCKLSFEVLKPINECSRKEVCPECGTIGERIFSSIAMIGDRDSFGIGKEFYDSKTKQYIDTFKKWEKAGFKQPKDTNAPDHIHQLTKEKMKKKSFQRSPAVEMAERI